MHETNGVWQAFDSAAGDIAVIAGAAMQPLEYSPAPADMRAEVMDGLSQPLKSLPCKFFYDDAGSRLFDDICALDEYYPTRTELRIMRDHGGAMSDVIGANATLVEYGSGASVKTRLLLDQLSEPTAYVPIDISRGHLLDAASAIAQCYPHIPVQPVHADYTRPFHIPSLSRPRRGRVVAYFPGSTIGNFDQEQALAFLSSIRATCGRHSGLLIGVDLKKDPTILHAAYNDAAGVTAAFNLNVLRRINRDLRADFDLDSFGHYAFYNPQRARVEMHLVSLREQTVSLDNAPSVSFKEGESIHTESCHKFTLESFDSLARLAGFKRVTVWMDRQHWFSVQYFVAID